MKDWIHREETFHRYHGEQVINRKHNDVFFIWMTIIILSVLTANFFVGITPNSLTGLVTGNRGTGNALNFLGSLFLVFINIFIVGLIYSKVTKKDY